VHETRSLNSQVVEVEERIPKKTWLSSRAERYNFFSLHKRKQHRRQDWFDCLAFSVATSLLHTPSFLFHPKGSSVRKFHNLSINSIHLGWINMVHSAAVVSYFGGTPPPPPRRTTAPPPAHSSLPTSLAMEPDYEWLLPPPTVQQAHQLHNYVPPPAQRFGGGYGKKNSLQRTDATSSPPPSWALLVSGATGATIGFVLGGPVLATMVGIGSAYAATTTSTTRRGFTATATTTTATNPAIYINPGHDNVTRVAQSKTGAASASQKHQHHHRHHQYHHSMVNGTQNRIITGAWCVKAREWNRRYEIWKTVKTVSLWSCKTALHGIGQGLGFVWHHGSSSSSSSSSMALIGKGCTRFSNDGVAETTLYPAQIH
jgi:hypothetical protein